MCVSVYVCARLWWRLLLPECICTEENGYDRACLLSPQNNCLWITWGESHWRYLEMTLPGDSLNHVHIRSDREFDFASPGVCVSLYVYVCLCDPRGYVVSFISLTHTEVNPKTSQLFITCTHTETHAHWRCKHTKTHTSSKSVIYDSAQFHVVTVDSLITGTVLIMLTYSMSRWFVCSNKIRTSSVPWHWHGHILLWEPF